MVLLMSKLRDTNSFLKDPVKRRRIMIRAIASTQRQEGREISDARAEEVYTEIFEKGERDDSD